jgi:hypothetical protein
MLPAIILLLALVSLVCGILSIIVNYATAIIEEESINLNLPMWILIGSMASFSYLFYLLH